MNKRQRKKKFKYCIAYIEHMVQRCMATSEVKRAQDKFMSDLVMYGTAVIELDNQAVIEQEPFVSIGYPKSFKVVVK